jgi:hypothetical protein
MKKAFVLAAGLLIVTGLSGCVVNKQNSASSTIRSSKAVESKVKKDFLKLDTKKAKMYRDSDSGTAEYAEVFVSAYPRSVITVNNTIGKCVISGRAKSSGSFLIEINKPGRYHVQSKSGKMRSRTISFEVIDATSERDRQAAASSSSAAAKLDSDSASTSESSSSVSSSSPSKPSFDYSQYADIHTKFSDDSILSQPASALFGGSYALKRYYVTSIGADSFHEYHMLLAKDETADPVFLMVFKPRKKQKFSEGTFINAYGTLNGIGAVNSSQIGSGISPQYSGDKVVLFMPDRVEQSN